MICTNVYTGEYREAEFARVKADEDLQEMRLDLASLRSLCARVLQTGGLALHCNFVAGDEPKWKDPSQRESLIELSSLFEELHDKITGREP